MMCGWGGQQKWSIRSNDCKMCVVNIFWRWCNQEAVCQFQILQEGWKEHERSYRQKGVENWLKLGLIVLKLLELEKHVYARS